MLQPIATMPPTPIKTAPSRCRPRSATEPKPSQRKLFCSSATAAEAGSVVPIVGSLGPMCFSTASLSTCPSSSNSASAPGSSSSAVVPRTADGQWRPAYLTEYHPDARYSARDLQHYADKVRAGASSAITQFFFNADAYFRFVDEARKLGADVPVVPGIMPITNASQLLRFSDACGAEVPRWIRTRLEGFGDDKASIQAFGLDVVTDLCDQLRCGGVPGLHFYTMNQATAVKAICERLGL